jgi:protein-S-isoprenylcysteine O-methyltransferase Ste14
VLGRRCDSLRSTGQRGEGELATTTIRVPHEGNDMAAVALALYIVFGVLALGGRCWMQWHRTGSTGYRGISRRLGVIGLLGGIAFIAAMMGGLAAPLLQLLGVVSPLHIRDYRWVNAAGLVLAVCGLAATMYAQLDMGDSWRVGVDTSETTKLVRTGTFKVVRNPIFAAMLVFILGQALLAPNPVAIAVFVTFLAAIEVSVRTVEEPYLLGVHGDEYRDYTARVGRFVPGIGLIGRDGYPPSGQRAPGARFDVRG